MTPTYSYISSDLAGDFDPASREILDFAKVVPSILDTSISKLNWIFSIETFTDGVDLSHWNWSEGREPDFKIIKENGFNFVILKSTQGNWFTDKKFQPGWMAALNNDLVTMLYHFFEGRTGGAEQARYCIDKSQAFLKAVDGKTIIWDDIEKSYGERMDQRQNRAKAFNQTIAGEGFETGNYSSPYLWKTLMGTIPLSWVNDYWQWVAHWTPALSPTLPIGWTKGKCKFWQYGISPTYSWAKKVGTNGNVDVNRFYGTIKDLKDILGINPPIPPDCCEEVKRLLAEVAIELVYLNDRISSTEQGLVAAVRDIKITNERIISMDLRLDQRIDLVNSELNSVKNNIAYIGSNQDAMQKQLDTLFKVSGKIKEILP